MVHPGLTQSTGEVVHHLASPGLTQSAGACLAHPGLTQSTGEAPTTGRGPGLTQSTGVLVVHPGLTQSTGGRHPPLGKSWPYTERRSLLGSPRPYSEHGGGAHHWARSWPYTEHRSLGGPPWPYSEHRGKAPTTGQVLALHRAQELAWLTPALLRARGRLVASRQSRQKGRESCTGTQGGRKLICKKETQLTMEITYVPASLCKPKQ